MSAENKTVGIREAAKRLSCTLKYVYDLVYVGKLPATKIARQWRIPVGAIEALLKRRGA